jgi:drug/metabolite transporter (DMT)-like permease
VAFSVAALGVAWVFDWGGVPWGTVADSLSDPRELACLCAVGVTGTAGQLSMTSAYARAPAAVVAPISYLNPLLSYGIGVILFDDPLTAAAIGGGALVIASSVVIVGRAGNGRRNGAKA